ncbi:MAG: insulinase family protein, partial [Verrucomicrobiales bacterium]|nr:insulinase family protein [Verrucomicrobiales bacterium]
AYADLPPAGDIAEKKEIEDIGVRQIVFENNVRANLKVTDFEDEKIYIRARIGGGTLTLPEDKPGLKLFTNGTFSGGGLEDHNDDELKRIFAGESVGVSFSVGEDAFVMNGATTPEDFRLQLVLMRAYLTNPGYRKEAAVEFRRSLDYIYQQIDRTVEGVAQDDVQVLIHGGDDRFGYPERSDLEKRTLDEVKSWLTPALENAYLEISIVGDFDKEKAIQFLSETFGNLPGRAGEKPDFEEERKVKFPRDLTEKSFDVETEIPKATVTVYWPSADIYDIKKTRRIGMLSAIMDDRLRIKIREELGDAYSPFAHNLPSDTWTDYGYLFANVTVDPAQAESVGAVVRDIAKELATGESITADELDRAKKPQVVSIEEMRRTNRYWLGSVLESSQEYPERLDWSRSFVDDYKSITLDEVNALAKEIFGTHDGLVVTVKPKAK